MSVCRFRQVIRVEERLRRPRYRDAGRSRRPGTWAIRPIPTTCRLALARGIFNSHLPSPCYQPWSSQHGRAVAVSF